jgi:hypothetical protein
MWFRFSSWAHVRQSASQFKQLTYFSVEAGGLGRMKRGGEESHLLVFVVGEGELVRGAMPTLIRSRRDNVSR